MEKTKPVLNQIKRKMTYFAFNLNHLRFKMLHLAFNLDHLKSNLVHFRFNFVYFVSCFLEGFRMHLPSKKWGVDFFLRGGCRNDRELLPCVVFLTPTARRKGKPLGIQDVLWENLKNNGWKWAVAGFVVGRWGKAWF